MWRLRRWWAHRQARRDSAEVSTQAIALFLLVFLGGLVAVAFVLNNLVWYLGVPAAIAILWLMGWLFKGIDARPPRDRRRPSAEN
jgi:hypothetical protein